MKHFKNYSLKDHNTLKIDVKCDDYFFIESVEELKDDKLVSQKLKDARLVIGDGANILFTKDFKGSVLQLAVDKISVVSESNTDVIVEADAGVVWHDLVTYAVSHNWGGIENMALIPGLVGAAAVGNIGAYGQCFSDVCIGLNAYKFETGTTFDFTSKDCEFSYRDSIFKHALKDTHLITSITIKLKKNPVISNEYWSKKHGSVADIVSKHVSGKPTIKNVFDAIITLRQQKFPDLNNVGTAGSFFKNPLVNKEQLVKIQVKLPDVQYYPATDLHYVKYVRNSTDEYVKVAAGEILDKGMGYRGMWRGNVGLFEKNALVLVTNGKATGSEVDQFASTIENDFYNYCGIKLAREVITI